MSLTYRIALGFLALLAMMVALAVYHLLVIHEVRSRVTQVSAKTFRAIQLSTEIRENLITLHDVTSKLPAYRLSRDVLTSGALSAEGSEGAREEGVTDEGTTDEDWAERLAGLRAEVNENLLEFNRLAGLTPQEYQAIFAFDELWRTYRGRAPEAEARYMTGEVDSQGPLLEELNDLRGLLPHIQEASEQALKTYWEESQGQADQAELVAQGAALMALVAALVSSLVVSTSVIRPLGRLARGTRELAKGDFSYRVPPSGSPELVDLAKDFNIMAKRLSALDQLKKDLVSNVSHDLKAPLASMQETTRLLLDRLPGSLTEKQARLLDLNLRCGERLSGMISDLLDLSRLEAQGETWPLEPLDLRVLVTTALDELENLVQDKRLQVLRDLPEEPVTVDCHGPSILQVLQNLVSNAVKFSPAGGEVGVRLQNLAAAKGSWWRRPSSPLREHLGRETRLGVLLEVWDSGPGVPDDHKERIFDRFHRVDTDRRGQQGTGLGLAIAQAIVQRHRGALWVEDRPEGGSSFRMVLWRLPQTPANSSFAGHSQAGGSQTGGSETSQPLATSFLTGT